MNQNIYLLLEQITPFPLLINNEKVLEGKLFSRPLKCQNCLTKECFNANFTQKYCSQGFRIYDLDIPMEQCKFIGVLTQFSRKTLPHALQKKYSSKIFDEKTFINWAANIKNIFSFITQTITRKQQEYIDGFHDITPTLNLIIRNAEKVINMAEGNSMEEKFDHSPDYVQTIYKSAEFLKQQLDFMGYLTNPESIQYGNKRPTRIYRLVDMMCRIAKQEVIAKRICLKLQGNSYNNPKIYNSLGTLIFILLDNAIKYSYADQDIVITLKDLPENAVFIDFMSYGPIIPATEIPRIFEKYYRYLPSSADSEKTKGHGFGLYIAKLIAQKHGFDIKYHSILTQSKRNGISIGENHFSVEIPSDTTE